ncbi:KDO2-lipid IV(A) lauroyltransferase [Sphaerotilus hippei]|uniref:KDO2-lipid IV(A) lauroyltransferase n=1 Tax=Sphaerotilus hippei TaxID=744406 RepID=A0A318HA85_9BURK|nr:lysophospholipid acyltransferase family protein [Sphaerotilus hippei]PXW99202.1 KDO2-lipid IV(A) lauroyltransferase [Sphaerotilus hippei]
MSDFNAVIESLFRAASGLSLPLLHRLGSALGWLTYAASPTYRRRMRAHVAQAGLEWAHARGAVASTGRMLAELPRLWCRPADQALGDLVRWEGVEHLETALSARRGLVMLTPHLGCFEVIAQAYAERFGARSPITALYRPARQPWLRTLVAQSRDRPGLLTAPATLSGVRQMIRALRQGGTVGVLPDQVPPEGMGVWAPFFGREAYTMTLASRLVQQTGAAWLLLRCERLPAGQGYVIHVSAPQQPMPPADDPVGAATVVNQEMERLIRACPHQYLWAYNRYKAPRAQPAAESGGEQP